MCDSGELTNVRPSVRKELRRAEPAQEILADLSRRMSVLVNAHPSCNVAACRARKLTLLSVKCSSFVFSPGAAFLLAPISSSNSAAASEAIAARDNRLPDFC